MQLHNCRLDVGRVVRDAMRRQTRYPKPALASMPNTRILLEGIGQGHLRKAMHVRRVVLVTDRLQADWIVLPNLEHPSQCTQIICALAGRFTVPRIRRIGNA